MNPECRDGKHPNCDGRAWDDDLDDVGRCTCVCHMTAEDLLDEYRGRLNALPLWLALSDVLRLHIPDDEYPEPGTGRMSCIECNRADQEGLHPTWWPCPTVSTIRKRLDVGRNQ